MDSKKEIIQTITKMSGKYSPDRIFSDWVQCSAIVIQNSCCLIHNETWKMREKQYINTMNRYTLEERKDFVKMLLLLTDAFEEKMSDILGEIYMESGSGSKHTGQFFTPFHVSLLTAKVALGNQIIDENEKYDISEPSVGGGGMIIATAAAMREKGINFQKCMRVTAQDLDWRSVYMTYVQLSLLGIDATVVQGDSLTEHYDKNTEESHILRTPRRMGVQL